MSFWDAASLAAAVTVAMIGILAEKIIEVDFSGLLKRNWKSTRCKKMLAQRKGPWQGTNVQGELRRVFDLVLLPLGKADKELLPARMDKNFRRRMEGQIELLERRKLCREIRLTDIVPLPKNAFRHWNDDGREWRESVLQCSALERLLPKEGGRPVHTVYRKNARLRVLQSRHIRSSDRAGKQKDYYAHKGTISCPSCGAEIELHGGVIQSDFYDWQTEAFAVYEQMGANQEKALWLLFWGGILYACLFLSLWLIQNTLISLAAGMGAAVLVLAAVIAVSTITYGKQEKLEQEIVRYSENYLRSCISEALYQNVGQHGGNHHHHGAGVHQRDISPPGEKTAHQEIQAGPCAAKSPVSPTEKTGRQAVHGAGVPLLRGEFRAGRKPLLLLLRLQFPDRQRQMGGADEPGIKETGDFRKKTTRCG